MTTVQINILDLVPAAENMTEKMLQEYRQSGLIFIYNVDEKPIRCFTNQKLCSLFVQLESMTVGMLIAFSRGILLNGNSIKLNDIILDAVSNIEAISDDSLTWMLTCVSKVIMTGIHSIDFTRDVSSLVSIKRTKQESNSEMAAGTSQFQQFANAQATFVLKLFVPKVKKMN